MTGSWKWHLFMILTLWAILGHPLKHANSGIASTYIWICDGSTCWIENFWTDVNGGGINACASCHSPILHLFGKAYPKGQAPKFEANEQTIRHPPADRINAISGKQDPRELDQ